MTITPWTKPITKPPSKTNIGEPTKDVLFAAVGRALSAWEYAEMFLGNLFWTLTDSRSDAAVRAYGTIVAARSRKDALEYAAIEFFQIHKISTSDSDRFDVDALIKAYEAAAECRNNIAHGVVMTRIATGDDPTGWFLQAPTYNSKKRKQLDRQSIYHYKSRDVGSCSRRFEEIQREAERLSQRLRQNYPP